MNYKEKYETLVEVIRNLKKVAHAKGLQDVLDAILEKASEEEKIRVDEEQMLIDITTAVRCFYSEKQALLLNPRAQKRYADRLPQLLDYLRKLPAWKPSEDQMNALLTAATYYGAVWDNPVSQHLMEIYNHFKDK